MPWSWTGKSLGKEACDAARLCARGRCSMWHAKLHTNQLFSTCFLRSRRRARRWNQLQRRRRSVCVRVCGGWGARRACVFKQPSCRSPPSALVLLCGCHDPLPCSPPCRPVEVLGRPKPSRDCPRNSPQLQPEACSCRGGSRGEAGAASGCTSCCGLEGHHTGGVAASLPPPHTRVRRRHQQQQRLQQRRSPRPRI